jgi:hypothetical protein
LPRLAGYKLAFHPRSHGKTHGASASVGHSQEEGRASVGTVQPQFQTTPPYLVRVVWFVYNFLPLVPYPKARRKYRPLGHA